MISTMMHDRATVQAIFRHGAKLHADSQVTTANGDKPRAADFAEVATRTSKLAAVLQALGVAAGDRVASFCANHQEHLEIYLAVPCLGAVLHTLNTRLFADQLCYMIEQQADSIVFVDAGKLAAIEPVLSRVTAINCIIAIGETELRSVAGRPVLSYDHLLSMVEHLAEWPELDESAAAVVCYTSGTTGDPKGVVYSHRSIFMHSLASMGVDTFAISERDRILLLPPMFHANAWGLPYTAWFAGSDLFLPASNLQSSAIRRMIETFRPSFTALVPTLINDLLAADEISPIDMSSFRVLVAGGSAVAPALIDLVHDRWGVPVLQGWGMTETSPICALSHPPRDHNPLLDDSAWRAKSGRPVAGVETRLCDAAGLEMPWNGVSMGELQLRGPWVSGGYYGGVSASSFTPDGWLRTGDVGVIDERGYVEVRDRAKDVIKSGGEWISSVELEGHLQAHSDVREVAIISIPDARWEERPLAVIALKPGAAPEPSRFQAALMDKVARFWIPDYWSFIEELPRTSVGKIDKKKLIEELILKNINIIQNKINK